MRLSIVERDEWLAPVEGELNYRYDRYKWRLGEIEHFSGSLKDYANAHLYYGVHYDPVKKGWWIREWLPAARQVTVFGDWNDWERLQYPLSRDEWGNWSIFISDFESEVLVKHKSFIKLHIIVADGTRLDRILSYI